jgi:twitching motility two-component system response regulator PilH
MPTVVVADDSPTLRRIVSAVLARAGYDVVLAEDGVQAVQAVFRTEPAAVVIDVQMPRTSGHAAARR